MGSLWSRIRGKAPELDTASIRWRSTLTAAAQVPFYSRWKKELARAQQASGDEARRAALLRLPEVELEYFFHHFRMFREQGDPSGKARDARSLWPAESRVAVVSPWFHTGAGVKLFLKPEPGELQKFSPEVLAAPVDALESLAASGEWPQDTPLFALVALTGVGTPLLSPSARVRLWRAFGVPVYVQLRGFQGELLARECEAHNGLHFDSADSVIERRPSGELLLTSLDNRRHPVLRLASRLDAWFETQVCDCGLALPRLMDLQPAKARCPVHAAPSASSLSALTSVVSGSADVPAEVETPL